MPTITCYYIPKEYQASNNEVDGFIVVNEPLGDYTGYLQINSLQLAQLRGKEVIVVGYLSDKLARSITQ